MYLDYVRLFGWKFYKYMIFFLFDRMNVKYFLRWRGVATVLILHRPMYLEFTRVGPNPKYKQINLSKHFKYIINILCICFVTVQTP